MWLFLFFFLSFFLFLKKKGNEARRGIEYHIPSQASMQISLSLLSSPLLSCVCTSVSKTCSLILYLCMRTNSCRNLVHDFLTAFFFSFFPTALARIQRSGRFCHSDYNLWIPAPKDQVGFPAAFVRQSS